MSSRELVLAEVMGSLSGKSAVTSIIKEVVSNELGHHIVSPGSVKVLFTDSAALGQDVAVVRLSGIGRFREIEWKYRQRLADAVLERLVEDMQTRPVTCRDLSVLGPDVCAAWPDGDQSTVLEDQR